MFVNPDENFIIFESSKRKFYANDGIIGLVFDPTECKYSVSEGYDGALFPGDQITDDERRELADYMIGLWTRFRDEGGRQTV